MKKNIKIVRNELNPELPNPPDFDLMVKNTKATKAKLLTKKLFIGSGLAVTVILALIVFAPKVQIPEDEIVFQKPIINPPSEILKIGYDTLFVDVKNGDTLIFNGCTQIIVPPNGIVTKDNENIESTRILYREFQNQTDIMLSGIPMTYDSAGVEYLFESGGMFEIKSINPNEKINLETALEVKMCSNHQQAGFNVYQLDENNGKWNYIEPIKAEPLEVVEIDSIGAGELLVEDIQQPNFEIDEEGMITIPINEYKAQVFNKIAPVLVPEEEFVIYVAPSHVEDLKLYENINFKPLASELTKMKKIPQDLDHLKIEETNENGVYLLTFYFDKIIEKVKCTPVFNDVNDYNKALAEFKKEEKAFKEEQIKKAKEREIKQKEEAKKMAELAKEWEIEQKKQAEMDKNNLKNASRIKNNPNAINYGQMVSAFSVNSFGYYNSDRPILINENNRTIVFEVKGENYFIPQLYQYYTNRNAVMVNYSFKDNSTNIKYTNQDECILVAVINNGNNIAIMTQKEFRKAVIENRQDKLVLKKIDRKFMNAYELNEYIKALIEK